ncbi:hypothetical protein ACVGAJ_003752 [Enterobacter hormaechei]|nr:hypothetical protein [Enterobacter hormaechei]
MKIKIIDLIYIISLFACIAFPFWLYMHHNAYNIRYVKSDFTNDIRYSIDSCSFDKGKVAIKGWAFLKNGQISKITRLYIDTGKDILPLYKSTTKTPDVMKLFGEGKRYNMSGFYGAKSISYKGTSLTLIISIEDTDGYIHETKYTCQ